MRILLNRCFGIQTYSLYDDASDLGSNPEAVRVVGHLGHGLERPAFRTWASESKALCIAKTHEMPDDETPAIYLVRDGRAAIVSYYHYRREIAGENITLGDIIRGKTWGGSWATHVQAWALSQRPNTLVVRYEQLVSDPQVMTDVGAFLGRNSRELPPKTAFAELSKLAPSFFRRGSNDANIEELVGNDLALFYAIHGPTMMRAGYPMR